MAKNNDERKTARNLLHALDKTIETGPWDKSVFLGAIGKKLKDVRYDFKNRLTFLDPEFDESESEESDNQAISNKTLEMPTLTDSQTTAYVSLYNANGSNIQKWEKILETLEKQIVSRPVYGSEAEIRNVMRAKINRTNEAYALFFLNKSDIITPKDNKPVLDRLGNTLLILKDMALKLDNVLRFYHESGVYLFKNNTLTKISDIDLHYFDA